METPINWKDLLVTDNGRIVLGRLEILLAAGYSGFRTFVMKNGLIDEWSDHYVFAEHEEPEWDTPQCAVDWAGFEDAVFSWGDLTSPYDVNTTTTEQIRPADEYSKELVEQCAKVLFDYTEAAIAFSKESQDWTGLPYRRYYTTDGNTGWKETCDNEHGGLNVSWAFHLKPDMIKQLAPARLLAEIRFTAYCFNEDE